MTYKAKQINPDDKLSITLHTRQLEVYHDTHRFKVLACGRRFGKTTLCANAIALRALSKPDQVLWIVSPTFPQTMYMWRRIKKIIPKKYIQDIKEGEKFIELINGSTIWAKSGDNPDGLVGEGLDFCAIDEAARCKEEVWEVLRPSLSDKNGDCWFLSTPKGKNWFYQLFLKEKSDPQYKSFHFPSHDNPILPRSELDAMKAEMAEIVYTQEVLAKFIDTGGIVFRNLTRCLVPVTPGPVESHSYVIGIDLGKHQDFTVLSAGDTTTNTVVEIERFNQLDWTYQKNRIVDTVKRYNNACCILDTTGIGDTIYDDLTDLGLSIEPYKFTNTTKNLLISNLMRSMDNQVVHLPSDEPEMISEFEAFEFDITDSGLIRYGAPRGMHDDIVISVALCVWGMSNAVVNVIGRSDDPKVVDGEKSYYDEDDVFDYHDEEEYNLPAYGVNRVRY